MNSLVTYDDSDSENERAEESRIPSTVHDADSSNVHVMPSLPSSEFNRNPSCKKLTHTSTGDLCCVGKSGNATDSRKHLQKYPAHVKQNVSCKGNFLPSNSVTTSDNTSWKSSSDVQERSPDDSICNERTVKPYIPKRLRQEQPACRGNGGEGELSRQAHLPKDHGVQNIFRASDYLRPYLHSPYNSTEIPRNLVFEMCEHTGPVNRVQWNPVHQYSHLLLSASMDATVKVWDAVDSGKCLNTYSCHKGAVRDAQWSLCGRNILSGGFESMLLLTDIETGKHVLSAKNEFRISAVRFHPKDPNVFLCAGFTPALKAWDIRSEQVIRVYKAAVQQHLELLFLPEGNEFLSSTDSVSRDSADRTIIAWDFNTAAKISNQIYHERYTCPSFALHPTEGVFVAQTNGNYMALFSTQRPYKINKKKRFEGHKVEGFAVGCEFSPDGSLIVTGSSEGKIVFYNYYTSRTVRSIPGGGSACVSVAFHPVLPSLLASSYWDGQIRVWQ